MKWFRTTIVIQLVGLLLVGYFSIIRPEVAVAVVPPQPWSISGVDAHDGMIYKEGSTYYLIGTKYGCGFTYKQANTPFCGFVVYTSPDKVTWTYVRELFDRNVNSPYKNQTWQYICGSTGEGCFNPRMTKRASDGVWILSFDAGADYIRYQANGYYFMGCNGPAGPCGNGAGAPNGGTVKPSMYICSGGGDHSIFVNGTTAYMVCTKADRTLAIEQLDTCFCNGINVGTNNLNGLTYTEAPDIFKDPDGTYVLTYGNNCPYCVGTDTSYAVSTTVLGPYQAPAGGRRVISGSSCGGQPRTVVELDGQLWQTIDTWYGSMNETNASISFQPFVHTGAPYLVTPVGAVWRGPFEPFSCAG